MAEEKESEKVIQTIDYLLESDAEQPEDRRRLQELRERVVEHESEQGQPHPG